MPEVSCGVLGVEAQKRGEGRLSSVRKLQPQNDDDPGGIRWVIPRATASPNITLPRLQPSLGASTLT